MTLCLFENQE